MRAAPALLALAACTSPPWDPDSLVDELRVAAVVASPPEVAAGDVVDLEVHVMDPDDAPRDVLVWFCTATGDGCLEATPPDRPLDAFARVFRDAALVARTRFEVPAELALVLPKDAVALPFTQWTLACRPGLCPIVDDVDAAPEVGGPAWHDVVDRLAAPGDLLRELPMAGVSLAVKSMLLSNRPTVERNRNPGLARVGDDALVVGPGGTLPLAFEAGDGVVQGLATAGAFGEAALDAHGNVTLDWTAPALPGRVDLLVVVEDGLGGTSVWRDVAEVR